MKSAAIILMFLSAPALATPDVVPTQANESSGSSFDREYATTIGTATAGTGSTNQVIQATATLARVGDVIRFTAAGANYLVESHVVSTTANTITLTRAIPAAPTAGDAYTILRLITPSTNSSGSVNITGAITATTATVSTASKQNYGKIVCSALTGSYATVITPAFNTCIVQIFNSCDQTIIITIDGGVTAFFELEAREATSLDFCTNGLFVPSGAVIQAKHAGVVPTLGALRISIAG